MPNQSTLIEAENFGSLDGFVTKSSVNASGGMLVQRGGGGEGSISTAVDVASGTYDLTVNYFDEDDGVSTTTLLVDGVEVASWQWDAALGSSLAGPATLTSRSFENLSLDKGSMITLKGVSDGGEPLRIDSVELTLRETTTGEIEKTLSDPTPALSSPLPVRAFPGAVGFGAEATGGRGGSVVRVTNLDDRGEGSLRWALEELDMPRIVVFDVGGVITLSEEIEVNGDVTVAGQTAPGEGVTIRGARLQIVEDNVIVRGLKLRPGEGSVGQDLEVRDAISVGDPDVGVVEDVIIDSNSLTWAPDENASIWGKVRGITFSNNIIAEALDTSHLNSDTVSKNMLMNGGGERVSLVGNLFANSTFRNPTAVTVTELEVINNYVYNPEQHGLTLQNRGDAINLSHVIGNVFEAGPLTGDQAAVRIMGTGGGSRTWLEDNYSWDRDRASQPEDAVASGSLSTVRDRALFASSDTEVRPASEVKAHVLATAGARAQGLDAADARILEHVERGTGKILTSTGGLGGYDAPRVRSTLADRDGDAIPDVYEARIGSDPDRADARADADGDGYANIEAYINGLIDGFGSVVRVPTAPAPTAPAPTTDTKVDPGKESGSGETDGAQEDGAPVQGLVVEAETMTLGKGYAVASAASASGDKMIQASGGGARTAELTWNGGDGTFDIEIRYYDENDGAGTMAVRLDGTEIDRWQWDDTSGGNAAQAHSLRSRVIEDVALRDGDVLRLEGVQDRAELMRVDYLAFTADASAPARAVPEGFLVEAEAMTLSQGFRIDGAVNASGGTLIKAGTSGEQRAGYLFDGVDGTYDVRVGHFDEADGQSELSLAVNGEVVGNWIWDRDAGSLFASRDSFVEETIEAVRLRAGDEVELFGYADGGEPLRIDTLEFVPVLEGF